MSFVLVQDLFNVFCALNHASKSRCNFYDKISFIILAICSSKLSILNFTISTVDGVQMKKKKFWLT